jgi:hypothetical protein
MDQYQQRPVVSRPARKVRYFLAVSQTSASASSENDMRDVGLNLCDFFPKLFEFFRIFGDCGLVVLDGVLNLATTLHVLRGLQIPQSALLLGALVSFWCPPHFRSPPLVAPIMGIARVRLPGCQ